MHRRVPGRAFAAPAFRPGISKQCCPPEGGRYISGPAISQSHSSCKPQYLRGMESMSGFQEITLQSLDQFTCGCPWGTVLPPEPGEPEAGGIAGCELCPPAG